MEPKARERLANLRLANPPLAQKVEMLILRFYQEGQLRARISEGQLIALLDKLRTKKETKIIRR
jgi:programmed cell death protein 5